MRLISFQHEDGDIRTGVVVGEAVVDLTERIAALTVPSDRREQIRARGIAPPTSGMLRLLYAGPVALQELAATLEGATSSASGAMVRLPLQEVSLLAPVPRPGKIVGVGRNYADHAKETGVDPFEKPRIIFKVPSSVTAPGSAVKRPAKVTKMDFEVELGVVIGAFASNVARADALDVVAGYTVLNDLSAREFQFDISPPQTTFAKSMDGFCPMGPALVTRDEGPDPQNLELTCWLNGERMQHANTSDMLFPVAVLIEYLSQFMTLEPGDVIATGTPAGIGAFRKPPVWLRPGDSMRLEVSGIGVLEHKIA